MHDIRAIRADPDAFDRAMERRGLTPSAAEITGFDAETRATQTTVQALLAERNEIGKKVGQAKRAGEDTAALEARGRAVAAEIASAEAALPAQQAQVLGLLESLPNILDADVPDGPDETANVVLHTHGEPARFNHPAREHFEIGEALGLMDFATAAKISGSRFVVLKGALARLERALGQWMLDLHTGEHGYTEHVVPLLVNDATMYGTGQLPKFAEDLFATTDGRFLIPTAEVPLTNLVRDQILAPADLPIRAAALSPCFRSEAGSAGRDTRGMLRQHQFTKVEMVSVVAPDASDAEHERMTQCAERVLTELGLTWRRVFLCAGDTGFSAARTYDLEVWLPGQKAWREISSCSNTRDFQARRMKARVKIGKDNLLVHTLNGSGVAVGRALIAVLETHQDAEGGVTVPEVLRPYMGGLERIARG
ncbi:MAG: serine--tRNA ligase [Pseudomonadota bacterium]